MAVTKTEFGRDPGLQARMMLTLFLLGALYVVFAAVLIVGTGANGPMILVICGGLALFQLFSPGTLALHAMGGRPVCPPEAPEALGLIDRPWSQAGRAGRARPPGARGDRRDGWSGRAGGRNRGRAVRDRHGGRGRG